MPHDGCQYYTELTGCTTYKIERNQQDIEQEKVEKNKKEIAS